MFTGQTNFLSSMGWAVISSLWQLALLWVVYQVIIAVYKKSSASFRASLAAFLLAAGFVWFMITFFITFTNTSDEESGFATASLLNNAPIYPLIQKIIPPVSILYLCLLIIPVSRFIKNYRYVQVIRKYGLQKADAQWRLFVKNISTHMNIGRKVEVWVSEYISSPITVGWLKPVILLPAAVLTQLSTQQVEALLLHELSHIRRYDYLLNLVINFIRTILYFNPFAKAFVKIVEREREKSCDEIVLRFQYNPREYATALLQLQQAASKPQAFILAATGKEELLQRVELILGFQRKKSVKVGRFAAIIALMITGMLFLDAVKGKKTEGIPSADSAMAYTVSLPKEIAGPVISNEAVRAGDEIRPESAEENTDATDETPLQETAKPKIPGAFPFPVSDEIIDNMKLAGFELMNEIPELKKYQEEQVKQAIEASKKVFNNAQWKAVERELAELLSQQEKKELRRRYQQQMEKFDWKNWENKLRAAYDKVDWERVNMQLNNAVNMVRLDSIQQVYADAVTRLDKARSELIRDSVRSIPDSEISIKSLNDKIKTTIKALSALKATKTKKIVRL